MFIPDPDFTILNPTTKKSGKTKLVLVVPFFVATKFKIILLFNRYTEKIRVKFQRIKVFFTPKKLSITLV
jgi:hypothetical protein